jgi:hypothetical protein
MEKKTQIQRKKLGRMEQAEDRNRTAYAQTYPKIIPFSLIVRIRIPKSSVVHPNPAPAVASAKTRAVLPIWEVPATKNDG